MRSPPRGEPNCISSCRLSRWRTGAPVNPRGEDGERFGQGVDLAAEAAADGAADEMQLVRLHGVDLGRGVEREEQRLGRGVDDEAAVGVRHRDRAVGLGRGVLDRRHLIALFQNHVGLREACLHVAEAQLLMIVLAVIFEGVSRIGRIDRDRSRLQRFFDVEHRGQRVIGDAHQRQRLERRTLAGRDDSEDRLALVAHDIGGERRLVVLAELDEA